MAVLKSRTEFLREQACVDTVRNIDGSIYAEHRSAQTPLSHPAGSARNTVEAGPVWTVMPIGDGSLDYRLTDQGCCLCRAVGEDAIDAAKRLLGSPSATSAEGYLTWKLDSSSSRRGGSEQGWVQGS